ncbi:MAG TPA: zinc ribbon domain-containing protein [Thermoplasmata archaeon]|nr:zinc ribbon domain-containing protein [Thermoplasmata archaeon]
MPFCPKCGEEVSAEDKVCGSCGQLLIPILDLEISPEKKSTTHKVAESVALIVTVSVLLAGIFVMILYNAEITYPSPETGSGYLPKPLKQKSVRRQIDKEFPEGYYNFIGAPPFASKKSLATVLGMIREYSNFIDLYEESVFDCSEMASLAETTLEQYGFETCIVVGPCPWNPEEQEHAWCLVKDPSDGELFPLECTSLRIPHENYYSYFLYDQRFNDIYEACEHSYDDFDWWNSEELENIKFYIGKFVGKEVCLRAFRIFHTFYRTITNLCLII